MKIPFVKYHGAGNDFILIDCCATDLPVVDLSAVARALCDRRHGIGADGLLLVLASTVADCRMRIFNADGSEAAMCGNGIRCLVDHVTRQRIPPECAIETMHSILHCCKAGDQIAVRLGVPRVVRWPDVVDTGVPHAVLFVEEDALDGLDVVSEGRKIRFHPDFSPHGVNVNFVAVEDDGHLRLRTYERGVESETLACGTGAAAAAFVASRVKKCPNPVFVATRSSFSEPSGYARTLSFHLSESGAIEMLGRAEKVFEGVYYLYRK